MAGSTWVTILSFYYVARSTPRLKSSVFCHYCLFDCSTGCYGLCLHIQELMSVKYSKTQTLLIAKLDLKHTHTVWMGIYRNCGKPLCKKLRLGKSSPIGYVVVTSKKLISFFVSVNLVKTSSGQTKSCSVKKLNKKDTRRCTSCSKTENAARKPGICSDSQLFSLSGCLDVCGPCRNK